MSNKEDEMLVELRKIREAVEKAPPPTPPKGLWNEFKDFLSKYKIFGLAIAFIIALYLGTLVQALVKDLLLPAIGLAIPGINNLCNSYRGTIHIWRFLGCPDNVPYRCFNRVLSRQSCQKMENRISNHSLTDVRFPLFCLLLNKIFV